MAPSLVGSNVPGECHFGTSQSEFIRDANRHHS